MTELQWFSSKSSSQLMTTINEAKFMWGRYQAPTPRKLRLLEVAGSRQLKDILSYQYESRHLRKLLPSEQDKLQYPKALLTAEEVADGGDIGRFDLSQQQYWLVLEPEIKPIVTQLMDFTSHQEEYAHIIHDLFGYPFKPLRGVIENCNWMTQDVMSLAQAAYEYRVTCTNCSQGKVIVYTYGEVKDTIHSGCGGRLVKRDDSPHIKPTDRWCERCMAVVFGRPLDSHHEQCWHCSGTGHDISGHLDPIRLSILADAIEDAGCDNQEMINHLRGKRKCLWLEHWDHEAKWESNSWPRCLGDPECEDGWVQVNQPHYRGCYVLDCLLGKE